MIEKESLETLKEISLNVCNSISKLEPSNLSKKDLLDLLQLIDIINIKLVILSTNEKHLD